MNIFIWSYEQHVMALYHFCVCIGNIFRVPDVNLNKMAGSVIPIIYCGFGAGLQPRPIISLVLFQGRVRELKL